MNLKDIKKIYFIGIGGIGMSALARYFHGRGAEVHGYDKTETLLTKKLVEEGMNIHYTEDVNQAPKGVDLVVYTPAVPATHKELVFLQEQGVPVKKRAEVLGIISRGMKTVAVAGTHGKTTTSSILTYLLRCGGIDCTAFLGGIATNFGSNFVEGQSDWVVVEADEFDRSFLHLSPNIAIILSMDADHLDIYGDRESLLETGFRAFAAKVEKGGRLYIQHQWREQLGDWPWVESFGIGGGTYRSDNVRVEEGYFTFDYRSPSHHLTGLQLALPGRHNVENATAALSVALQLGVEEEAIRRGLRSFRGIRRRFEMLYRSEERAYVDDYAHHPSELKAAIGAARELFPGKRITGIFQPHLFSRTRDFADGFAEALDELDEVLLMDIYPARELPIEGVDAQLLLGKMKNQDKRLVSKENLLEEVKRSQPQVLLTLGAGDIDTFREAIKEYFEKTGTHD
ncbi:MAG: UDP-N-acetylmuramate--L-alanine ligase [Lewinellaceae bacterium]|nr:UDP-N-acetylmuramate--L-alanine ligase [Phaeodactylibacter sp.]MCB0613339.1 UDP-N-acetylmuramate--L-alanine ligase [Phaeodactylibacter sp.]MCB9351881.1 UDP-N-acetylmuramate--L-alanine ligase [Lewinellaceae bacterium]